MTQDWLDDWQRWHDEREHTVLAPHGTASLAGTHWLGGDPLSVPGLEGSWRTEDGVVTDGDVRLAPGDETLAGDLLLTAIERDGELALRVWDPEAPTRTGLAGIDTFAPDPGWAVTGRLEPAAETLAVDHVDGHTGTETFGGVVRVTVAGHELGLVTLVQPDGRLLVPFADTTNGTATRQFRFLKLQPDAEGAVEVDLNRAYLPPCAFADHYLCPMPPRENRLTFAVEAGETHPRLR